MSDRRPTAAAGLAACLLALVACAPQAPQNAASDRFVLEPIELTHEVAFLAAADQLDQAGYAALAGFVDGVDPGRDGQVLLGAVGPRAQARLAAVAAGLAELGSPPAGAGPAPAAGPGVRVTLRREVMLPVACLNQEQWLASDLPPANCTTGLTLVQMAEDQNDLQRGRPLGPASGAAAAAAVERYLAQREQPGSQVSDMPPAKPTGVAPSLSQPIRY